MISGISTRFETNRARRSQPPVFFSSFSASFIVVSTSRRSSERPNHFHQQHHRHGIHEVHPHKTSGRFVTPQRRYRNGRSVLAMITSAANPSASPAPPAYSIFSGRLRHKNPQPQSQPCPSQAASRPRTFPSPPPQSCLFDLPIEVLPDRLHPTIQKACSTSRRITLYRPRKPCAIPFPIVPAPSTHVLIASIDTDEASEMEHQTKAKE